jgi:hypothetical protein
MPCPFHAILSLTNGPTTPKARTAHTINLQPAIQQAKQFATGRLPILNEHVLAGRLKLDDFIREITPVLEPFSKAMFGRRAWWSRALRMSPAILGVPNTEDARRALQQIGFVVDSLERHSQALGITPGAALAALSLVPSVMTILGYAAGTVPRSTAYSYWIGNPLDNAIYFTRNPGEAAFHRAVVTINAIQWKAAGLLRPVATLDELPDSREGIERLQQADDLQHEVLTAYKHLAAKGDDGQFVLTPRFFTTVMRTFLPTYPVADEALSGPNAAYLLNQRSVDALMGVLTDEFEGFVRDHEARYMPVEDQHQLAADLECPSIAAQLSAKALDLSFETILHIPDETLVERMSAVTPAQRSAFDSYFHLCNTAGRARSVHRAMVKTWLEDEEKRLSPEEKTSLPVRADQGTGGAKMASLDAIVEMIKHNPRVGKLWKAFEATGGRGPTEAARIVSGCYPTTSTEHLTVTPNGR